MSVIKTAMRETYNTNDKKWKTITDSQTSMQFIEFNRENL